MANEGGVRFAHRRPAVVLSGCAAPTPTCYSTCALAYLRAIQ
jgi:hypothetical protein